MNLNYTVGIPDTPNNPSNDQPPMKTNTNSINSIIQIDHHGFKDNLGGYHTIIHQDAQLTDPANIPGPPQINQIYVKSYTPDTTGGVADTQLYTRTALGAISQLTGHLTTSTAISDGWQWVGGVLIQWGFVSLVGISFSGTVTFKDRVAGAIPFPNNCFFVNATRSVGAGTVPLATSGSNVNIVGSSVSITGFDYVYFSTSGGRGFYWIAVGN